MSSATSVAGFAARRADRVGQVAWPWLVVAATAGLESFALMPFTADWASQPSTLAHALFVAKSAVLAHWPTPLVAAADPIQGWPMHWVPALDAWMVSGAVFVVLTSFLALVREQRAATPATRVLRMLTSILAVAVGALYVYHLLVNALGPVFTILQSVHYGLLLLVVAGLVMLLRLISGEAPIDSGWATRSRKQTAGLWGCRVGVPAVLTMALGAIPLPALATSASAAVPEGTSRVVALPDRAILTGVDGAQLHIAAVDPLTARTVWAKHVSVPLGTTENDYRVSASATVVYVEVGPAASLFAFAAPDGKALWSRPATIVTMAADDRVLIDDVRARKLILVDSRHNRPIWSKAYPVGGKVVRAISVNSAGSVGSQIGQVDRGGTIRFFRVSDGEKVAEAKKVVKDLPSATVVNDHLLWVQRASDSPATLVAYAVGDLKHQAWTHELSTNGEVRIVSCGPLQLCVSDPSGVTALRASDGQVQWRLDGSHLVANLSSSIVVTGPGGTRVIEPGGRLVADFGQRSVQMIDAEQLVVYPGEGNDGVVLYSVLGMRQLGRIDAEPAGCSATARYLICMTGTVRVWYF